MRLLQVVTTDLHLLDVKPQVAVHVWQADISPCAGE